MENKDEDLDFDIEDWNGGFEFVNSEPYVCPDEFQADRIVRQETAILAKQKGFNWLVNTHYAETPVVSHLCLAEPDDQFGTPWELEDYNKEGWAFNKYSAPTQSFLQRWLREKHNLHIEIQLDQTTTPKFAFQVIKYEDFGVFEKVEPEEWFLHRTYEDALEEALMTALKRI